MTTPKAHEQHTKHAETVADEKHDPAKKASQDGGAENGGAAEPKGTPNSDRHLTETAKSK